MLVYRYLTRGLEVVLDAASEGLFSTVWTPEDCSVDTLVQLVKRANRTIELRAIHDEIPR